MEVFPFSLRYSAPHVTLLKTAVLLTVYLMERASIQLVSKWLDFSVPGLVDYPLDFQAFLSHLNKLIALEITKISRESSISNLLESSISSTSSTTTRSSTGISRSENDHHKKLRKILDLAFLDTKMEQTNPFPGIARFSLARPSNKKVFQYACVSKPLSPEQVRNFLTEGITKINAQAGVLFCSNEISGARRFDIFGIPGERSQVPVIFISCFPKQERRMENLLNFAMEILKFIVTDNPVTGLTELDEDKAAIMPKILHSLSHLVSFIETYNPLFDVLDGQAESVKLPEYSAVSLAGNRVVMSRSVQSTTRPMVSATSFRPGTTTPVRTTATASATVTQRTVRTTRVVTQPTVVKTVARGQSVDRARPGSVRGRANGTPTVTVTSPSGTTAAKRFMSVAARGPASGARIQRDIAAFNAPLTRDGK